MFLMFYNILVSLSLLKIYIHSRFIYSIFSKKRIRFNSHRVSYTKYYPLPPTNQGFASNLNKYIGVSLMY